MIHDFEETKIMRKGVFSSFLTLIHDDLLIIFVPVCWGKITFNKKHCCPFNYNEMVDVKNDQLVVETISIKPEA